MTCWTPDRLVGAHGRLLPVKPIVRPALVSDVEANGAARPASMVLRSTCALEEPAGAATALAEAQEAQDAITLFI